MVAACGRRADRAVLFLDITFLAANLLKVFEGGWVPLALGGYRDAA
jgi:K+ transporter